MLDSPPVPPSDPTAPSPLQDTIAARVRAVAVRPELWLAAVRLDGSEPVRVHLPSPPGLRLWLVSWPACVRPSPHAHTTVTAFTVVLGQLEDVRFDEAGGESVALSVGWTRVVQPGVVHDVHTLHGTPAVSIHGSARPRPRAAARATAGERNHVLVA